MIQLLSLAPQTMLIMIVFSSFLQAGIITVLDIVANQYKGISLYMFAAVLYALGVSVALFPVGLEAAALKFGGNIHLLAQGYSWQFLFSNFSGQESISLSGNC